MLAHPRVRRAIPAARLVIAATALAIETLSPRGASLAYSLVYGAYTVYAAALLVRRTGGAGVFGLLALFTDTIFFLVLSNHLSGRTLWLAGFTFLYLMIAATANYGAREVAMIAFISIIFFLAAPDHLEPLRLAVAIGGMVACVLALARQSMARSLTVLEQQVAAAKESAARAQEEERQRIAADFHDGPLQSFISFQIRLEILRKIIERDPKAGLEDLRQLQQLAKTQIAEIRTFVRSMRPLNVEGANLTASVRRITEDFQKETGIPVTFLSGDANLPIAPEVTSDIVQMVREALHNVQKHAGATRVAVAMDAAGKALEISVDDNGSGFDFSGAYNLDELDLLRLGPVSLKQRARSLNAELQLESRPGRGASIRLRIPM
jgi:signal transduction histidine kinase